MRQRIIEAWAAYQDLEAASERVYDEHVRDHAQDEWSENLRNIYAKYHQARRESDVQYGVVMELLAYRVCRLPSGKFLTCCDEAGLIEVEEIL